MTDNSDVSQRLCFINVQEPTWDIERRTRHIVIQTLPWCNAVLVGERPFLIVTSFLDNPQQLLPWGRVCVCASVYAPMSMQEECYESAL